MDQSHSNLGGCRLVLIDWLKDCASVSAGSAGSIGNHNFQVYNSTCLEQLNSQTKAIENIQDARLEFLESQTKAVENVQATRLEFLSDQTKAVENVQEARLEFLENQTKAVENVHETRLEERARRNKSNTLR